MLNRKSKDDGSVAVIKAAKAPKKVKAEKIKPRKFKAIVIDENDKEKKITVVAENRALARMELANKGLNVLELNEKKSLLELEIGGSISQAGLLQVTRQLAAFSAAGVPLLDSILMLAESSKSKQLKAVLNEIANDIRDGETLPQAARHHGNIFPGYYISILESSERTGEITETFEVLASYLERDLASNRAVKSAMYYPIILITLAVGAVIILSTTVLPKFSLFFASLNTKLPKSTQILLNVSNFFSEQWIFVLLGMAIAGVVFNLFLRTEAGRLVFDKAILKAPLLGEIIKIIILERFTRVMGSLTKAGVPLPDALTLASTSMGNSAFRNAVRAARDGVIRGEGLAEPLEASKVFPVETIQILRVGEQSGRLTDQLSHASNYYAKEVDYRLKNLTALVEPVVLAVVGGGVGFVAIALVSAMYGIYSSTSLGG